jgi:hypothetical protein
MSSPAHCRGRLSAHSAGGRSSARGSAASGPRLRSATRPSSTPLCHPAVLGSVLPPGGPRLRSATAVLGCSGRRRSSVAATRMLGPRATGRPPVPRRCHYRHADVALATQATSLRLWQPGTKEPRAVGMSAVVCRDGSDPRRMHRLFAPALSRLASRRAAHGRRPKAFPTHRFDLRVRHGSDRARHRQRSFNRFT